MAVSWQCENHVQGPSRRSFHKSDAPAQIGGAGAFSVGTRTRLGRPCSLSPTQVSFRRKWPYETFHAGHVVWMPPQVMPKTRNSNCGFRHHPRGQRYDRLDGIRTNDPNISQSCKLLAILTKSATEAAFIFRIIWPR